MKLPNAEQALIEPAKLWDYVLSPAHPVGRFKAAFFVSLGYSQSEWEQLRDDLLALAASGDAIPGEDTGFGRKFEVDGILVAPSGRSTEVRTVWLVANEGAAPRFVTAYPR